jgi:CHAT domain-containing protein/tetratricopeptide (TPR) repeat protein
MKPRTDLTNPARAAAACASLLVGTAVAANSPALAGQMLLHHEVPIAALASEFEIKVPRSQPGHRIIAIDQYDADVELEVAVADGRQWKFDAPARRAAPERACVFDDGRGLTLELRARSRSATSGKKVLVAVAAVRGKGAIAPGSELEAECLESRAAIVEGPPPRSSPMENAEAYERAAKIWESHGNLTRAGYARLQSAWMLSRRTSEPVKALSRGQDARRTFRAARDSLGESFAVLQMAVPRIDLLMAGLDADGKKAADARLFAAMQADMKAAIASFEAAGIPYFGAQVRNQLATGYYTQDDLDAAIQLQREAADLYGSAGAPDGKTRALANRSLMIYRSGRYREAAAAFDEVLRADATRDSLEVMSDILNNSATTHAAVGNYDKALSQLVEALAIQERTNDLPGLARSLNGLASTYLRLGNARAAVEYSRRAHDVLVKRDPTGALASEPARLDSVLIAGEAYRTLGDLTNATASHQEALTVANTDIARARARLELARDALDRGDASTSLEHLTALDKILKPAWGMFRLQARLCRAQALLASGHPVQAIAELDALRGQFANAGAPEYEIETLEALSRAQWKRAQIRDALATSKATLEQLSALRLVSGNPELRARLNDSYRSVYELRVELLFAQMKNATPAAGSRLLTQVLAAADEARAGLARSTPLAQTDGASNDVREREEIAAEIALRQRTLSLLEESGSISARAGSLRSELAALRARFDAASPRQDAPLPVFSEADYATAGMRDDIAILIFIPSGPTLARYLIARGSIRELEAISLDVLTKEVNDTRAKLSSTDTKIDATTSLMLLSQSLLPDAAALSSRKRLIVVADALTAQVPFGALSNSSDRYSPIIATHDVSMALTLRDALALARMPDRVQRVDLSRVAIFSDPVFNALDPRATSSKRDTEDALPLLRLSGTAAEADAIVAGLPAKSVKAFSGFRASREALLSKEVADATVLHLATHAVASDRWPNGSGLMLSALKSDGSPVNGYVSTLDLFSRRTATDLVVLSACDTARGESGSREGVAGLARAVLGGGARRVVAAQWAVDDEATARVMREFYRRLADGDSAARALSTAQRTVREVSQLRSPARWAGFVIFERTP